MPPFVPTVTLKLLALAFASLTSTYLLFARKNSNRRAHLSSTEERVLVLGASSGIGRAIALRYAQRGARVCLVGRKRQELTEAETECSGVAGSGDSIVSVLADFTSPEDLVRVRNVLVECAFQYFCPYILANGIGSMGRNRHARRLGGCLRCTAVTGYRRGDWPP